MLLDLYNRPIYNLRISVTSKCNLKCFYCHSEGIKIKDNKELSIEDMVTIAKLTASYGVKTIKLTGGEPLLRKDILEVVKSIYSLKDFVEISMVTNGLFLKQYALELKMAGLKRVNVSLPTLNEEKFKRVTGGELNPVLDGIREAVKAGLNPVKINMVLLKGINEEEIDSMIAYSVASGTLLQIIELEPVRISSKLYAKYHKPIDALEKKLAKLSKAVYFRDDMHKRKIFELDSTRVEVVHPIENTEFCSHCNRLRVTYDGFFKPCLMVSDNHVDIRRFLETKDYDALRSAFLQAVILRKPFYVD
ncbi:MAG: GTP 3',8-cyclase MoaA [Nitrososphaeria archaeon]